MNKKLTLGLIAGALALSTAAFAPTEAQARNNDQQKALNYMAMQMYMNQVAQNQQQAYYNSLNPYPYGNPYYNNGYNNGYYNRAITGNGWHNHGNWRNGYYNNRYGYNTVGKILNRIF